MSTANTSGADYSTPPNLKNSGSVNNGGTSTRVTSNSLLRNVAVSKDQTGVFASTVVDGADTDPAIGGGTFAHKHTKPITARVTTEIANVASSALSDTSNNPAQLRSINKREAYRVDKTATAYRNGQWDPYYGKFEAFGTYSRTGTTVTVTSAHHGLVSGDSVKLDFTSGSATDGVFAVTVVDENSFTVTHGTSGSTSGNVTLVGPAYNTENPGTDVAANPSRSAPGDLVFRTGAKLPVRNYDYKAKTG